MTNGILYVLIPLLGSPVLLHLAPGKGGGGGGWGGVGEGCTFPYMDLIDMCRRRGCGF